MVMCRIDVDLKPDDCAIYKYWQEYCRDPKHSAVRDLSTADIQSIYWRFNHTKRSSYNTSVKKGYLSREVSWSERTKYLDDIHAVNISKSVRQGREMSDAYVEYPKVYSDDRPCEIHYSFFVGCFLDDKLLAYVGANVCGDLAAASQILGHGEHLQNGIMLNVWYEFMRACLRRGIKVAVYSRWSDGLDGLKSWKTSVGMHSCQLIEKI